MSLADSLGPLIPEPAGARVPKAPGARAPEDLRRREPEAVSARVPRVTSTQVLERATVEPKVGKRSDVDYRAVKVFLPIELHMDAKHRAEKSGYADFSALVEELVRAWYSRT